MRPSTRIRATLPILGLVAVAGCASSSAPGDDQEVGEAFVVRPIDPDFVSFDGRRVSIERVLFDLREAVRRADAEGRPRPLLRIELPPTTPIGAALTRLRAGADLAGVDRIEIETADT